MKIIQETRRGY